MLITLLVVIGLSILILGHEAGHFLVAKLFKLKVDEFGFGFPPRLVAWRPTHWKMEQGIRRQVKSETEYSLNWLPFGGFVKIAGENEPAPFVGEGSAEIKGGEQAKERLFNFQPVWIRALVIVAGVAVNFVIGWILLTVVLLIGTPQAVVIAEVQKDSPAAQAGFQAGDVVRNFTDSKSLIEVINAHRGEPLTLSVLRGGKDVEITAVPRVEVSTKQGALGILLADAGTAKQEFFGAVWGGLKNAIAICGMTVAAFYSLIKNLFLHGSLLEGVVGPVGIFSVAQETGKIGWAYLIQLVSIISLNLAVVNLMPFPALDGGRLFLIAIEKIKGSPISRKIEATVNTIGFAFLILLMVLLTFRDVRNLL